MISTIVQPPFIVSTEIEKDIAWPNKSIVWVIATSALYQLNSGVFILINEKPISSGMIAMTAGSSVPSGWLLCDGAAVSRTTYVALFTAIGILYGAGDGSTTFNLPDLRQKFPLGKAAAGTGSTLGGSGGTIDHIHVVDPPSTNSGSPSATLGSISLLGLGSAGSGVHTHAIDIPAFNSGSSNPPFLSVNFVIKI